MACCRAEGVSGTMFSNRENANLFATIGANDFAGNRRKMLCMTTRGKLVRAWREARGLKTADVARMANTSRQNIENLESDEVAFPRYLPRLAKAMGYARTDDLLALKPPPDLSPGWVPPAEGTPEIDPKAQMLSHLTPMIDPITIAWELILSTLLPPLFRAVIPDDAMSPDYPKGLEFIWSTTKTPQVSSLVMVRDAHDQAHVREYRQGDGPGQWEAAALNRAFKSFNSKDGLTILAVAAFRSMP